MPQQRLTFIDWLIVNEIAEDERMAVGFIKRWANNLLDPGIHKGDCTNESQPCEICSLEIMLEEYSNYTETFFK